MTASTHTPVPAGRIWVLLVVITSAVAALSITRGAVPLAWVDWLGFFNVGGDSTVRTVVLELRLPRTVLALLVGAGLASSGVALQAVFRNPLADAGLIGVSAGGALAAVAVIVLQGQLPLLAGLSPAWILPLASFSGGAAATWLVARLSRVDGMTTAATMLLVGLAVNAIAGAGLGLLTQIADDSALRSLTFWLYGNLGRAGWPEIAVAAPLLLAPTVLLPARARALDALLLGEAEAGHLGLDVERLKREVVLLALLAVGAAVAVSGMIGFVGLLVPNLVRLRAGPSHGVLLPASALIGATLLTLADLAARTVALPRELPVGLFTALAGGPFFIGLLLRLRRRGEML